MTRSIAPPSDSAPPSRRRRRALVPRFIGSDCGVAALEFALIAPFLITLMLGGFEVARYVNTMRRLTYLANSIAEILAQNNTGTVDWTDLQYALDSTMVTFPNVLGDSTSKGVSWGRDIQISMASVAFTPTVNGCTSGCVYNANVAWTFAPNGASARPCNIPLQPASDTSQPSPTTLPSDTYGPGSLIAVDVVYNYTPVAAKQLFGTMTIRRSFYLQPRYVTLIKFTKLSSDFTTGGAACPGY